jgi:hypothetical protein
MTIAAFFNSPLENLGNDRPPRKSLRLPDVPGILQPA